MSHELEMPDSVSDWPQVEQEGLLQSPQSTDGLASLCASVARRHGVPDRISELALTTAPNTPQTKRTYTTMSTQDEEHAATPAIASADEAALLDCANSQDMRVHAWRTRTEAEARSQPHGGIALPPRSVAPSTVFDLDDDLTMITLSCDAETMRSEDVEEVSDLSESDGRGSPTPMPEPRPRKSGSGLIFLGAIGPLLGLVAFALLQSSALPDVASPVQPSAPVEVMPPAPTVVPPEPTIAEEDWLMPLVDEIMRSKPTPIPGSLSDQVVLAGLAAAVMFTLALILGLRRCLRRKPVARPQTTSARTVRYSPPVKLDPVIVQANVAVLGPLSAYVV